MLRWHPYPFGISFGEALLWAALASFLIYWINYWHFTFDYLITKAETVSKENVGTEVAARTIGHCTSLFSAFVMLPASRTGLWVDVFAVPYERALKYHRFLGVLCYMILTLHACAWWGKWWYEGNLGTNIFAYNYLLLSSKRVSYMEFTIPLAETVWFLMTLSLIMALFFRRVFYNIFQYSHTFIGVLYYVTAIVHAWSFWYKYIYGALLDLTPSRYYAVGGLMLWLCDKYSRGVAGTRHYAPENMEWHSRNGATMLKLMNKNFESYKPGQYFFVNIPAISLNEWHPFTASAILKDGIVLYIKRMPKSAIRNRITWSERLGELVDDVVSTKSGLYPTIRLHGPFGHTDFTEYESLLLFAGGIGITPMIGIFTHLRSAVQQKKNIGKLKSVVLCWNSRSVAEFKMFETILTMFVNEEAQSLFGADPVSQTSRLEGWGPTLGPTHDSGSVRGSTPMGKLAVKMLNAAGTDTDSSEAPPPACKFDIQLHCTRRESYESLTSAASPDRVRLLLQNGRCDIPSLFSAHAHGWETMAAACGPPALMQDVSQNAWLNSTDFHAEQFLF